MIKADKPAGAVVELQDNIFLIPGRKSGSCNVFVLKGSSKIALIDVGMPGDHDLLCTSLAEIGLTINDIDLVVVTHEHIDHFGGLKNLPKRIVVAAHSRTANKLRLGDDFSSMGGAFGEKAAVCHVDIHLEDGSLIDLGGIRLRTIYTPGHVSGAICLYEPDRGILFTADTIFSGGILGGIFASGNVSDYINSLQRLREFRLVHMYPGHGQMSDDPTNDLERAIKGSTLLMDDTRKLFEAIKSKTAFDQIKRATIEYSRRAADRRKVPRIKGNMHAMVHLDDADHPVVVTNISRVGMRLDHLLDVARHEKILVTIASIGDMECEVAGHHHGHSRLKFLHSSPAYEQMLAWVDAKEQTTT